METAKLDGVTIQNEAYFSFNALQLVQDKICLACAQVSPIPGEGGQLCKKAACLRFRRCTLLEDTKTFFYRVWMFAWGSYTLPTYTTTTTLSRCDGWKAHCLSTGVRSSGVCSLPACPLGIAQPTIRGAEKSFSPLSFLEEKNSRVDVGEKQWDGKLLKKFGLGF